MEQLSFPMKTSLKDLMKNYHNPQIPEGINVSKTNPLLTFLKLFSAILVILVISAWLLGKSGAWLAMLIPFEKEVQLTLDELTETGATKTNPQLQQYLDGLVARLEPAMQLPEGMQVQIHYESEDVENAFATLGGHLFFYKGLLKQLPNENALTMLIAHEMAHVKHRDPIRSMGQKVAISAGVKAMLGYSNIGLLGNAGLYTQLHFSREMETRADEEGMRAMHQAYGHIEGALDLYSILKALSEEHSLLQPIAFFSTHPLDDQRVANLNKLVEVEGWFLEKGTNKIIELPEGFRGWL